MMVAGLAALVAAGLGTLLACAGLICQIRSRKRQTEPIQWPPTWAEIVASNNGIPPTRSVADSNARNAHRHSLHCTVCGRFAKRVHDIPGAGWCRHHSYTLKVATGPIDIEGFSTWLHDYYSSQHQTDASSPSELTQSNPSSQARQSAASAAEITESGSRRSI